MRVSSARSITYAVVGTLGFAAVKLAPQPPPPGSPPGGGVSGSAVSQTRVGGDYEPVRPVDLVAGASRLEPVLVLAASKALVDTIALTGVINSSLFAALDRSDTVGLPRSARRELAWLLSDIFEYRVDMSRDLHRGDEFAILVERVQEPGGRTTVSKILGANLALSGQRLEAIRFNSQYATGEYFDAEGKSLRASFLRAPLSFRRVSSVFGMRYHPVLGRWRRHAGTDYAAAPGTPVRAIGDGVVIFAGWRGGYGRVLDIRHRNGYVSRYGHLRSFSRGVTRGRRVKIGQTIGSVGMTGLATGPHLHFEVLVGGRQRNPRVALTMRGGEPIARAERGEFQSARARTLAMLRAFTTAAVGE